MLLPDRSLPTWQGGKQGGQGAHDMQQKLLATQRHPGGRGQRAAKAGAGGRAGRQSRAGSMRCHTVLLFYLPEEGEDDEPAGLVGGWVGAGGMNGWTKWTEQTAKQVCRGQAGLPVCSVRLGVQHGRGPAACGVQQAAAGSNRYMQGVAPPCGCSPHRRNPCGCSPHSREDQLIGNTGAQVIGGPAGREGGEDAGASTCVRPAAARKLAGVPGRAARRGGDDTQRRPVSQQNNGREQNGT